MKTFPKTITAKIEGKGDEAYLSAAPGTDMNYHADTGGKVKVAVYKLVEVVEVELVAKTRQISKVK